MIGWNTEKNLGDPRRFDITQTPAYASIKKTQKVWNNKSHRISRFPTKNSQDA